MPNPRVQLVLRSADINPTIQNYTSNAPTEPDDAYTNPVNGNYINRFRTQMIFKNVNLRSVLSGIYEKGARYMLKLESISFHLTSNLTIFSGLEQERSWNIFLKGFPFMKSWNNGQVMSNEILLSSVRVPSGGQTYNFYYHNSNEFTFEILENQYNEYIDIQIELRDQLTNTVEPNGTYGVAVGNSQYVFSIYKI